MRRKLIWTCLFGTVVVVTGCGGGGGGGGGGSPYSSGNPYLREVPYSTPVRVGAVKPMNSTAFESDSSALFSQSLSGNGEELITAGRSGTTSQGSYPTYNLNVFGWSNGSLVNRTSQWFSGTDNVILGTEPSVKFADFNGDGKKDMYVSSNTDTNAVGSGWVFFNNGTSFSRTDLNLGVHGHDSAVYDINGDGRSDIFTTGSRVSFGNANNTFTSHVVSGSNYGGTAGSVAIADFMGNGGSSIILTDQNSWQSGNNRLYSWSMTDGGRPTLDFELSLISTLPNSRFLLPKWSGYGFSGSHDYRSLAFDFDNSGKTSAIIFSRPALTNGVWPDFNEIQFLKNQGGGSFIDVTDATLVGYNTSSSTVYNPSLIDINSDGLIDIVLGGTRNGAGAQVLIHTSEHKYVASYGVVIDAFIAQSATLEKTINASAEAGGNGIVFVKGPDGNMYLATAISYNSCQGNCSSYQEKAIYLSKLGATTVSATATAAAIKQVWPWMSDGQINTVLAQSSTTWFGMNILDPEKAFQPIGGVGMPLSSGKVVSINGYISGVDIGNGNTLVTDSVGRAFSLNLKPMNISRLNAFGYNTEHNDQYELTSHAEYLVNGGLTTVNGMRIGSDYSAQDSSRLSMSNKPSQYTIGVPKIYSWGKWNMGTQYTYLNTNPWIAFGGAWGEVTGSGILDNVITYRNNGFSAQASLMHVTTNITPGLITRVDNMWGAWAETGYRFGASHREGDLGLYAGMKPVVLSGSVEARLPTGVDNSGNIMYTNKTLAVQNQATGYVRALYTNQLTKQTQLRLSAMSTTTGQYRAMTELKFYID